MTSKLHVLGESVELDALMLACPSYKKKDSKSRAKMLEQLRRAYRSAKWNWQGTLFANTKGSLTEKGR